MKLIKQKVILEVKSWIGTPYHHQQSVKHIGTDCLGLLLGVWREIYGSEPKVKLDYSPLWNAIETEELFANSAMNYMKLISDQQLIPGNLVLFRMREDLPAKHAGILTENKYFVHSFEHVGVCETKLTMWWQKKIAYEFEFPN